MKSEIIKLLELMSDWNWHTNKELNSFIGWNFKDKLLQLREKGCIMEREWSWKNFKWRLTFIPEIDIIKWKIRLKDNTPKQIEIKITRTEPPIVRFEKQWLWNSFINLFK